MSRHRVVVVGGGLAGVTAALRCVDTGFDVTLVESRPRLGGATYSFRRGDLVVDTGQHVFLRCYSAYTDLLRRIGTLDGVTVQRRFHVPVLAPGGGRSVLRRWPLPAPAHLVPALFGHHALSLSQRAAAMRTAMALRRLDPLDPALDRISFGEWLQARREPQRTVQAMWGLLAVAALNAQPHQASLALAVKVFRTGMLDTAHNGDIGIPRRPLGELHGEAAYRSLIAAGAGVRLRGKAREVRRTESGMQVVVREGDGDVAIDADAVVVAVPHQAATALLANLALPEARFWSRLAAAPIVNVHVLYDRPVTDLPMAAVIDSPLQWVFDRTSVAGAARGQYLAVSLSAAHEFINARTEDLRRLFLAELQRAFPRARRARVRDFFVTREPHATFLQAPGSAAIRPSARTSVPGLVLAGAWTATGWPDTIEGAVLSGHHAAAAVQQAQRDVEVTA